MAKHIVNAMVENHAGILSKISGLFARRGFNIDSLAVGVTQNPEISAMTIIVNGDAHTVDQVTKQLSKLVGVLEVRVLSENAAVSRELSLIKVACNAKNRSEIAQIVQIFRASIIDISENAVIIELTGTPKKIDAFERMCKPYGIEDLYRTGMISMSRTVED
ncbi:MAG: acetolactate synthase small subunit [Ruminococcaceae bacterium]|nr:acetolactate synthase small subunit [Oscillospiraceae bacterium]